MLIPKFGDPADPQSLKTMLSVWLRSNAFKKSELDAEALTHELTQRCKSGGDFIRIIELIERGEIDTSPWITHHAAFDEMIDAFPRWTLPETGVIKAMVEVT